MRVPCGTTGKGARAIDADLLDSFVRVAESRSLQAGRLVRLDVGERLPSTFVRVMYPADATLPPAALRLIGCLREQGKALRRDRSTIGIALTVSAAEPPSTALVADR